jgi:DNA segregation ATPase FtsK/SpoIIIE, S-DNA-T family
VLCAGITSARSPEEARLIFVDYRRSLLDSAEVPHQIGYATSSAAAVPLLADVREALVKRLPPPDLTPEKLRARSWWSGADLYLIVDDYDLVASTSGSPLSVLADLLPQARDIGLHVLLARSAGGAGRAMFEPVVQRLREMGSPGLIMSGSRDEGQLLGGVRPMSQPVGRTAAPAAASSRRPSWTSRPVPPHPSFGSMAQSSRTYWCAGANEPIGLCD